MFMITVLISSVKAREDAAGMLSRGVQRMILLFLVSPVIAHAQTGLYLVQRPVEAL